jgi:hypothetical protein
MSLRSEGSTLDPDTACTIRYATADDVPALRRLLAGDSRRVFCGPALVAEVHGDLGAAVSLANGQVIADPAQPTWVLTRLLRTRHDAEVQVDALPASAPPTLPEQRSQEARSGADSAPHAEGA